MQTFAVGRQREDGADGEGRRPASCDAASHVHGMVVVDVAGGR
jgi:hypothetical protein